MPEEEEREKLDKVIRQWNNNRVDLFEISQPDKNLEFYGVMRFYYEDHDEGNVATKCLRVCSNSSTQEVIETLSEKFRPDMKMLTTSYSLYEIQGKKERKLEQDERPLIVQLNWSSDNREGRFVLKKHKDSLQENCHEKEKGGVIQNFKRTLSRKDKKTEKNKEKAADSRSSEKQHNNSSCVSDQERKHDPENRKQDVDEPVLPFGIKISESAEEAFLSAVINYTNSSTVHFKLSPAYILYAVGRSALQRRHPKKPEGQTHTVTSIANKMVAMTGKVIQRQQSMAGALAFWMANASELLNFLKHDKDLGRLTQQSQLDLSHLVHKAYSFLLQCLQNELAKHLPTFLIDPEQHGVLPAGIEMVLNTLMNAMSLMRRCRVNPALTIQLFSQLFHFISAWLFNRLMSPEADAPGLRSHYWGAALRQRLTGIEAWAERQGLELAADCHLGHIIQATTLLTMNKYSLQDAKDIQNTCFKLNSLQLQTLLAGYLYANSEPRIPPALIDGVVTAAAAAAADNLVRSEGRDVQLEEGLDLNLPFLLPEGGYSCHAVRGIPQGFTDFMEPICKKGLCSLTPQQNSTGDWTVHFAEPSPESTYLSQHREPEVVTITLKKPLNSGMGVSIVAAKGAAQGHLGIYIKSIVKGGPAEMNGGLTAGDQLLSVDGRSLIGLNQERAAAIMLQTGPVVNLQVAKFGASFHGLAALLRNTEVEENYAQLNGKQLLLHHHGGNWRRKQEMMQRNRQLYRSNPNMTSDLCLEDGDEKVEAQGTRRNNMAAVSTINLCTDREYLTLPSQKSQDKNPSACSRLQTRTLLRPSEGNGSGTRTYMRQAVSQENLCVDAGGPLLDARRNHAKQTLSHFSSFPLLRSSVSSHDIICDHKKQQQQQQQQQGLGPSAAGVWRAPFSQQSTPTPSVQPVRIDIPLTRSVGANPPLVTFQNQISQNQNLVSATRKLPQQQQQQQQQQRPGGIVRGQASVRPQVSITPTKHVSFQEPPRPGGGGPPGADPWARERREELEKQQRLRAVELLEQEVQQLQAKAQRSAQESERLRRLGLEWQFQKRLREVQQRGEDEEEEEEEEEEMMVARTQKPKCEPASTRDHEDKSNAGQRASGPDIASKENQEEKNQDATAPENLTFKERQRLFSLASSA